MIIEELKKKIDFIHYGHRHRIYPYVIKLTPQKGCSFYTYPTDVNPNIILLLTFFD